MKETPMKTSLEFVRKIHIGSDIWQLHFKKPAGLEYLPGQFLHTVIEDLHPDERGIERWFTISSSPTEKNIIITTRLISGKHSEFKDDLFHLKPGDDIKVDGPEGKFVLPAEGKKILWIAGGIGVTPFISQMQYLLDTKDLERNIVLLYGLRTLDEDPCTELVKKCQKAMPKFQIERILSETIPKDWNGQTGYIDAKLIKNVIPDYIERELYVSGPEPMVDAMKAILLKIGVDENNLHQDWFPGYKEKY